MKRTTTRPLLAGLAAVALLVAACAPADEDDPVADPPDDEEVTLDPDEDEDPPEPDEAEPVSLTVDDIAGTPSAFLQFAVDQGFFEEQNLDVTVEVSPGGAANIPGVVAGEFEIAGSNIVAVLLARGEGLELQMVSAGTFGPEDPAEDFARVLVPADSDIEGPEDLDGRSIAVNTLSNIAELTIRAGLENLGATHENVELVEIGFPDMLPAMADGQVDAVFVIEPFVSVGLAQGNREIFSPYADTSPNLAIGSYFSSDEYIAQNPDVIDRFIAGVSAAGEYIGDNPDEFRAALPDLAGLEPDVAEVVNVPAWGGPVDVASVELIAELMVEHGLFAEAPPTADVVFGS